MNYTINGIAATEDEITALDGDYILSRIDANTVNYQFDAVLSAQLTKEQAKYYLSSTDFKDHAGTLTALQIDRRNNAKVILEGSFVEPDSDLFHP